MLGAKQGNEPIGGPVHACIASRSSHVLHPVGGWLLHWPWQNGRVVVVGGPLGTRVQCVEE